ncbi:DUF6792 domain-containing protein [Terribacillus saccharophilus]|uniref:DUF6792 domain-containing protein n=1 Tax=Terribacillus saccharophilus TaxID=361277 RepID=A0ABX4GZ26_9BACI|nr:DUF6792 domain-containing protein [Terribacillus saccharophilus]PAD35717.1 hypothetical protein CHH56_08425 [Terribacillus saccharophilus]PAD96561.1 hypothetical protein CHH50_08135 [Terribacillus saccharophilus]PAE00137.1 hypothetical protein CHH48_09040 [Terribacillus saccharophilus]
MAKGILDYELMAMRLTNKEYENMTADKLKSTIQQIYLEETGSLLDADIKIFHSSDTEDSLINQTGYNGTAIYIDDGNQEEMYVISQGTTNGPDWSFNAKGPLAGESIDQPQATDLFVEQAKNKLGVDEDAKVISWGHSLGHHNNAEAYLGYGTFDEVYGMNGAQVNAYQLFDMNIDFQKAVIEKFKVRNDADLRQRVSADELEVFTKEFFKDESKNIHQIISSDDPLNGLTPFVPGMVELGQIEVVDTNPDVSGIKELAKDIPPEVIKDVQDLALIYAKADNAGGTKEVAKQLFGVNMDYLKDVNSFGSFLSWYTFNQGEFDETVKALNKSVPPLLDKVRVVLDNKDLIFGRLQETGYISLKEKDTMIEELELIESHLSTIEDGLNANSSLSGVQFLQDISTVAFGGSLVWIKSSLTSSIECMKESGFFESLNKIVASHSIPELLAAMSKGNKSYFGTDMVYTATNGDPIKVNISAALRMYRETLPILEEKETKIRNFEKAVKEELDDSYKDEKRKVQDEIDRMESSPGSYRDLLAKHGHLPAFNKEMKTIKVHEVFYPLENNDFDEEIHELKKSVESGKLYIEKYRKAIEDLFDEEDNVSRLFDFSRRF